MAWTIRRIPPEPGEHSLGGEVLIFGPQGTAETTSKDVVAQALLFPQQFFIQDTGEVVVKPPAFREADMPEISETPEAEPALFTTPEAPRTTLAPDPSLDPDALLQESPRPAEPSTRRRR